MSGQVGFATEATWGTIQTPTKFVPVDSASLRYDPGVIQSKGIRSGRVLENKGYPGAVKAGGRLALELPTLNTATFLKHCIGSVVTTGSGPYLHTYTPAPPSEGVTIQTGVQDASNTVQPFTASGSVFDTVGLSCDVGGLLMASVDFTSKDVATATALAVASYPTFAPWTFVQGALVVGGSPFTTATQVQLQIQKNLRNERHRIGSRYINQQRQENRWSVTGSLSADFESLAMVQHIIDLDDVSAVFTFTNGTNVLTITLNIEISGDFPGLNSQGLEKQDVKFRVQSNTTDLAALAVTLTNGDSSAA